ncbi:MAG: YicC family protein [Clostridia bacterium]|nr:YicC family protein [Clostridia bacterium]
MQSMTGCGSGRASREGWEVTADLKTVNHRFLDISLRLPRNLNFLEQVTRKKLSSGIKRGHVDVFLNVRNTEEGAQEVQMDLHLARGYMQAAKQIGEALESSQRLELRDLMALEGVVTLTEREMDQDIVQSLCGEALEEAIVQLTAMRAREGEHLREDLRVHLAAAAELRERILERAPLVVSEYKTKLEARLAQLGANGVDPQRLAQEVALMADRCAIDEELSRLESHLRQMNQYLGAEGEIGKKMDFLIQEMNREVNTIGSKAQDAEIAQRVVDLKSEIEKLREQIQNVE